MSLCNYLLNQHNKYCAMIILCLNYIIFPTHDTRVLIYTNVCIYIQVYVCLSDARRVVGRTVDIEGNMVVPELVRDIRQKDICAIRIDNISPDISDKILKLIFESKSASGGGEIEDMFVDRDNMTAVITYVHLAGSHFV